MENGRFPARRAVISVVMRAAKRSTDSLASERRLDSLKVLLDVRKAYVILDSGDILIN